MPLIQAQQRKATPFITGGSQGFMAKKKRVTTSLKRDKTPATCLLKLLISVHDMFLMEHSHYLDTGPHNACL